MKSHMESDHVAFKAGQYSLTVNTRFLPKGPLDALNTLLDFLFNVLLSQSFDLFSFFYMSFCCVGLVERRPSDLLDPRGDGECDEL